MPRRVIGLCLALLCSPAVLLAVPAVPAVAAGPVAPAAADVVDGGDGGDGGERPPPTRQVPGPPNKIGIQLLDVPVGRADDPRAKRYIVDHVAPGQTIERRVKISNHGARSRRVEVYAAAATIEDNRFTAGAGRAGNELSDWVHVDKPTLDLKPDESQQVWVTIDVPSDAPEGEQYGVVWAHINAEPAPGSNVALASRVGVRLYVDVGPGGEPRSDFEIGELVPSRTPQGRPIVHARVRNTGGRAVDLSGSLSLRDGPGGLNAGPFSVKLGTTIAPGKQGRARIELDQRLPDGPWTVELTIRSGRLERTVEAKLTFPQAGTVGAAAEPMWNSWPLRTGIGTVALAALGVLGYVFRTRRRA